MTSRSRTLALSVLVVAMGGLIGCSTASQSKEVSIELAERNQREAESRPFDRH